MFIRLILVPSSLLFILIINFEEFLSGIILYVFLLIFVGGLLILLVRRSTIIAQEVNPLFETINIFYIIFISCFFLNIGKNLDWFNRLTRLFLWEFDCWVIIGFIRFLLIIELVLIRWLIMKLKSLTRSLCSFSVVCIVPFQGAG